jgi:hypothetical protein
MTNPTLLGTSGHGSGGSFDNTFYSNIGLGRCAMDGNFTTEERVSQTIRAAGTISYLSWRLTDPWDGTLSVLLRQNSANTDLAISWTSTTTGWVTVAAGDVLDFATSADTTSYSGGFYCVSARLDASSASAQLLATVGPQDSISQTTSRQFVNFLGILSPDTSEGHQQFECLAKGTWQNMACYINSNSFSAPLTVNNRISGSNGSMAISTSSGHTTGYFEDTMHSDSVNVDDLLCYSFAASTSDTETLDMDWVGAHFLADSTNLNLCMIGGSNGTPATLSGGSMTQTTFSSLFGGQNVADNQLAPRSTGLLPYALTASNFTNYIPQGDTGTATFSLLNGNTAVLSISITSEQSGYIAASGTSDFGVTDTCTNEIDITSGVGTSIKWASASLLLQS